MLEILSRSACFILIIVIGYLLKRIGVFKDSDFSVLSNIVLKITLPAVIISNFANKELDVSVFIFTLLSFLFGCVYILLGFLFNLRKSREQRAFEILNYPGYNIGCFALLLLLVFRPSIVRKCAFAVLDSVDRIRPLKRKAKLEERLDHLMQQYAGTAEYFRSHHIVIANVFMITLLQRIALFLVTWYAYRAIGLEGENFVTIVIIQAMISVAVDMLPLPGGMGVSENLFLQMFLPLFGETIVLPGMVISRGISYYTQLIISAGMTLYASFALKKSERRGENRS